MFDGYETWDCLEDASLFGNGVSVVVVRVTSYRGKWESHLQGEGKQVIGCQRLQGTRDAKRRHNLKHRTRKRQT